VSDAQILNVALTTIPTMVVVLIGILINNARLNDTNARLSDMNTRLNDVKEMLRSEIASTREVLEAEMEKNHSEMLHRFGDLDIRLTRIEGGLGMSRG
jgi:vacuolar-type H+-ATPase subunit I/STV1